eukprot:413234-Hanusia_phi.AAC.1
MQSGCDRTERRDTVTVPWSLRDKANLARLSKDFKLLSLFSGVTVKRETLDWSRLGELARGLFRCYP